LFVCFVVFTVPVEKVYVMAGDRVELVCDVTSSAAAFQQDDVGYAPAAAISSRSSLKGLRAGQQHHHAFNGYYTRHHIQSGERRRRNRRYNNNHHHRHSTTTTAGYVDGSLPFQQSELTTMDDGYLVLWFVDPDRKPFYRYITLLCILPYLIFIS
jgi:hypothetical protein